MNLTLVLSIILLSAFNSVLAQSCKSARTVRWRDPRGVSHDYLFSWENEGTKGLEVDWNKAQSTCREHCMDLVSLETGAENDMIKQHIANQRIKYIWTGGRKSGNIVTGWYWYGSGLAIGPTNQRGNGDWSHTGGGGKAQPDNRENTLGEFGYRGNEENCLSLLNNFYHDGIKWHDVACYHTKPFVCESG